MASILREIDGNLIGLDDSQNLLLKGSSIILDYLGTPKTLSTSRPFYDVKSAGVVADGTTNDYARFSALITALGSTPTTLIIDGPILLGTAVTVPSTIELFFVGNGAIKTSAATITLNCSILANPNRQIFIVSSTGLINGLAKSYSGHFYTEWFGALGDDATDDATAFQKTAALAKAAGYVQPVKLHAKTYLIGTQIFADGSNAQTFKSVSWIGAGPKDTKLHAVGVASGAAIFRFRGGSGQLANATVEGITFYGDTAVIGITLSGKGGMKIKNCRFSDSGVTGLAAGVRFWNEETSSFTEFNELEACEFYDSCTLHVEYKVSSGGDSFHGSGLTDNCILHRDSGTAIQVGLGSKVYSAPLSCTVFCGGTATLITNASTTGATFYGHLATENVSGVLTLASGTVALSGTQSHSNEAVTRGGLIQCSGVTINSDGSRTFTGGRTSGSTAIATGANVVGSNTLKTVSRLVHVQLKATTYDRRYLYYVSYDGISGGAGVVTALASHFTLDTPVYGAAVATVATDGGLTLTQAGWPASGVTAYWTEEQIGATSSTGFWPKY